MHWFTWSVFLLYKPGFAFSRLVSIYWYGYAHWAVCLMWEVGIVISIFSPLFWRWRMRCLYFCIYCFSCPSICVYWYFNICLVLVRWYLNSCSALCSTPIPHPNPTLKNTYRRCKLLCRGYTGENPVARLTLRNTKKMFVVLNTRLDITEVMAINIIKKKYHDQHKARKILVLSFLSCVQWCLTMRNQQHYGLCQFHSEYRGHA